MLDFSFLRECLRNIGPAGSLAYRKQALILKQDSKTYSNNNCEIVSGLGNYFDGTESNVLFSKFSTYIISINLISVNRAVELTKFYALFILDEHLKCLSKV